MSLTGILALSFIIASTWWISRVSSRRHAIIHLILLLITPWVLTLIFGEISLKPLPPSRPKLEQIPDSISYYTSFDFLFFSGDKRPGHGTGEHGIFLFSFLPAIAVGLYRCLSSKKLPHRVVICWLISGFSLSLLITNTPGIHGGIWFLPSLSVLASYGAVSMISSQTHRFLVMANALLLAYEALRLYQVLIFHQPFIYT